MTEAHIIQACINKCAAARDERGRWRPEDECRLQLWRQDVFKRPFGWSVDADCAAAAMRIGAWLATR